MGVVYGGFGGSAGTGDLHLACKMVSHTLPNVAAKRSGGQHFAEAVGGARRRRRCGVYWVHCFYRAEFFLGGVRVF